MMQLVFQKWSLAYITIETLHNFTFRIPKIAEICTMKSLDSHWDGADESPLRVSTRAVRSIKNGLLKSANFVLFAIEEMNPVTNLHTEL